MKKSRSLCEKRFTSLVLTASFAMAIEYLMLLSDSIIIGNMLGEAALAGHVDSLVYLSKDSPRKEEPFFTRLFR